MQCWTQPSASWLVFEPVKLSNHSTKVVACKLIWTTFMKSNSWLKSALQQWYPLWVGLISSPIIKPSSTYDKDDLYSFQYNCTRQVKINLNVNWLHCNKLKPEACTLWVPFVDISASCDTTCTWHVTIQTNLIIFYKPTHSCKSYLTDLWLALANKQTRPPGLALSSRLSWM